eukprot:TRINITY_DN1743_c0_g1_i1.p1 TRINITY_DN1743_c0_g1~~TRINITY_DN1743_c0_g1_i1.p1  ORF type:complete len:403 (+),score=111.30 TRINITY_DN1743_c0_g1_i1:366-1574(+)
MSTGTRFLVSAQTQGGATSIAESTRFEDLSAEDQKKLIQIQARINQAARHAEALKERSPAPIEAIESRIETLRQSVAFLQNKLERESKSVHSLRAAVRDETRHVDAAKRDFTTPSHMSFNQRQRVPKQYFWDLVAHFEERMQTIHARIEEVYQFLNAPPEPERHTPEMLQSVLEYQTELFVSLAAQTSTLHDDVQAIKQEFLEYRLERNLPDPFQAATSSQSRLQSKKKKPLLPPFEDLKTLQEQAKKEEQQRKEKEKEAGGGGGFGSGFGSSSSSSSGSKFGSSGFGSKSTGTASSSGFGAKSSGSGAGFGAKSTGSGFGAKSTGSGSGSGFGAKSTGSASGSGFGAKSAGSGFGSSSGGKTGSSGFGAKTGGSGFGAKTGGSGFGAKKSGGGFGSSAFGK